MVEKKSSLALQQSLEIIGKSNMHAVKHVLSTVNQQLQIRQHDQLKREVIKHHRFFEAELSEAVQIINGLKLSIHQAEQSIKYKKKLSTKALTAGVRALVDNYKAITSCD